MSSDTLIMLLPLYVCFFGILLLGSGSVRHRRLPCVLGVLIYLIGFAAAALLTLLFRKS